MTYDYFTLESTHRAHTLYKKLGYFLYPEHDPDLSQNVTISSFARPYPHTK